MTGRKELKRGQKRHGDSCIDGWVWKKRGARDEYMSCREAGDKREGINMHPCGLSL